MTSSPPTPSEPGPDPAAQPITLALQAAVRGERDAADRLLPLVYDELKALARAKMGHVPPGNTLQPTALVHEAYMRLVRGQAGGDPGWQGRGHFFGAAAQAMRNILVEQARRKAGPKAGGGRARVELDVAEGQTPDIEPADESRLGGNLLALNGALSKLQALDPRKAEVVMLKFFAGLEHQAIAETLGTSVPTVERDWRFARSWLAREMGREDEMDRASV